MDTSLNGATAATLTPEILAPEVADAFLRTIWRDIGNDQVPVQTHDQNLLRLNALEVHGRNYAPLLALQWGLTSLIAQKTGTHLLPSFAWFRLYFGGDICRVHSDRPACEVSLSLTLGYSDGEPWALNVGTRPISGENKVADDFGDEPFESFSMQAGDGVLYRGSLRRHGRIVPNPNRWSAHAFLQWVDPDGPHSGEAFERLDFGKLP